MDTGGLGTVASHPDAIVACRLTNPFPQVLTMALMVVRSNHRYFSTL